MGRLNSALSSLADKGHFASNKAEAPEDGSAANTQEANDSKNERPQPQSPGAVDESSDLGIIKAGLEGPQSDTALSNQAEIQFTDAGDLEVEIQLDAESNAESNAESSPPESSPPEDTPSEASPPEDTIVNSAPDRRELKDEAELTSGTDGIEYLKDKLGLSDDLLMAEPEPSRPEIENYVEDEAVATPNVVESTGTEEVSQVVTPVSDQQSASVSTEPESFDFDSPETSSSPIIESASSDVDKVASSATESAQTPSGQTETDDENQLSTALDSELDPENLEVMQLVEQVLGIRPDLRIDNSAPIEEQLAQINELLGTSPSPSEGYDDNAASLESPNASVEIDASTYDEGVTIDFGDPDAALEPETSPNDSHSIEAADEDDSDDFAGLDTYKRLMEGGFGVQNEASDEPTTEQSADTSSTQAGSHNQVDSTSQVDSDSSADEPYRPVMEAWANIDQSEPNANFVPPIAEDSTPSITIDVEDQQTEQAYVPPITDDEVLDDLSRQAEDISQSSILGDLTSPNETGTGSNVPEPVTSIGTNADETGLVNELPPPVSDTSSSGISRRETKPKTISGQIASQDVGTEKVAIDSGNNLVPPSDYEIKLASKMVNSEFGEQVQGLAEQIMAEVDPDECQILMFVGMEQNRQRADIVSGLSMFVSPQREKPTLLIDADPESRVITRGFEQRGSGILEVIAGKSAWRHCTTPTGCQGLHMMPCGLMLDALDPSRGNQVELISEAVDAWRQTYGLIMLDAGIAVSSLSRMLAKHSDSSFICVQIGKSPRELLVDTTEFLIRAGATVKGCITTNPR